MNFRLIAYVVVATTLSLQSVARASDVLNSVVETHCDQVLGNFSWRAFFKIGNNIEWIDREVLRQAGFQTELDTACNTRAVDPRFKSDDERIITVKKIGRSSSSELDGYTVSINFQGETLFTVENVWSNNAFAEHVIVFDGFEGRYCVNTFDPFHPYEETLTEFKEQKSKCRFFSVYDAEKVEL